MEGENSPILSLPVDERGSLLEEDRDAQFRRLRSKLENRSCFDCSSRNPMWMSLTHAVYLCLNCSGTHRRMGTHISFVRSCELDNFTPEQLLRMELGGNNRARIYFKQHGLLDGKMVEYHGKHAAKYKQQLDKLLAKTLGNDIKRANTASSETISLKCNHSSAMANNRSDKGTIVCQSPSNKNSPLRQSPRNHNQNPPAPVAPLHKTDPVTVNNFSAAAAHVKHHHNPAAGLAARKLDFDFDFDEIENEIANPALGSNTQSAVPIRPASLSEALADALRDDVPARFQGHYPCQDITTGSGIEFDGAATTNIRQDNKDSLLEGGIGGFAYEKKIATAPERLAAPTSSNKWDNAKSISSADFFNDPSSVKPDASQRHELQNKFHSLRGAKAFSSDAFFNGSQRPQDAQQQQLEEDNSLKLDELAENARQGFSNLATGVSQAANKAKDWFNIQMQR